MKLKTFALFVSIAIPFAGLFAQAASRDEAEKVLERYMQKAGGRDVIEKINTTRVLSIAKERNQEMEVELQMQIPDKVLFQLTAPNGMSISMGLTSAGKAWRNEGDSIQNFKGDMAIDMYRLFLGLMPRALLKLQTHACLDQAVVTKTNDTVILTLTPEDGKLMALQFDQESGLLVAVDKHQYGDYREVSGVKVPFSIKGQGAFSLAIKEVKFNAKLNETELNLAAWTQDAKPAEPYQTLLSPPGKLEIMRKPFPMVLRKKPAKILPKYNADQPGGFSVDLRGMDCTQLVLVKEQLADLMHAHFDTKTRWPALLPEGFDPTKLMELGQNPGLKLRQLHQKGNTGRGIGIGIIDQTLLVDHREYRERLKLYEEIHNHAQPAFAMMHGAAVASIAVGKTVGVAPEADLYYIAETHGEVSSQGKFEWDFTWLAKSIDRLLEINQSLPDNKKIRVISISVGWSSGQKGYAEANAAVKRATAQNVFVISTSIQETHRLFFHGLGRQPYRNPDEVSSYIPGSWWADSFYSGNRPIDPQKHLLVPMDSRCIASPSGPDDYVYYAQGGWSWSVPYLAGLYALACQVKPEITPEEFWKMAIKTGKITTVETQGKTFSLGAVADPIALIEVLK